MLLTNNSTLKTMIEDKFSNYEGHFQIKVFGSFNQEKLEGIRKGATIKGKKLGPFFVV